MHRFTTLAVAASLALGPATSVLAQEIYAPNLAYRTGPFASTGIPLMDGQADYMTLLNDRDGGIAASRSTSKSAKPAIPPRKAWNATERTKSDAIVTQPWSTGITLQVLPQTNTDQIPILAPGYGFFRRCRMGACSSGVQPAGILLGRAFDDRPGDFGR